MKTGHEIYMSTRINKDSDNTATFIMLHNRKMGIALMSHTPLEECRNGIYKNTSYTVNRGNEVLFSSKDKDTANREYWRLTKGYVNW